MATYASLSDEDKAVVDNFTNILRAACGEAARLMNHLDALKNDANAISIFGTMDAAEPLPNMSGLAGADTMTKTELQGIYNNFNVGASSMLTVHNIAANRQAWTKACGIANMIG